MPPGYYDGTGILVDDWNNWYGYREWYGAGFSEAAYLSLWSFVPADDIYASSIGVDVLAPGLYLGFADRTAAWTRFGIEHGHFVNRAIDGGRFRAAFGHAAPGGGRHDFAGHHGPIVGVDRGRAIAAHEGVHAHVGLGHGLSAGIGMHNGASVGLHDNLSHHASSSHFSSHGYAHSSASSYSHSSQTHAHSSGGYAHSSGGYSRSSGSQAGGGYARSSGGYARSGGGNSGGYAHASTGGGGSSHAGGGGFAQRPASSGGNFAQHPSVQHPREPTNSPKR
jgi:hypothetical protein